MARTSVARAFTSKHAHMYDDWNLILELDGRDVTGPEGNPDGQPDNTALCRYTWGLDLSGLNGNSMGGPGIVSPPGLHGAGGIGGLLAVEDLTGGAGSGGTGVPPVDYLYLYDANGNVSDLVSSSDGAAVAHYEYDPYGNAVVASGDYAAANPFRFSTKWLDAEIGQYYYGYRYLYPPIGRWTSRDPAGERYDPNAYRAVWNAPGSTIDALGLCPAFDAGNVRWTGLLAVGDSFFNSVFKELSVSVSLDARIRDGLIRPNSMCCPNASVVQIARESYGQSNIREWVLDTGTADDHNPYPYYPHSDWYSAKPILQGTIRDEPGLWLWKPENWHVKEWAQDFETCIVCVPSLGKIGCPLGCIHWRQEWYYNSSSYDWLVGLFLGARTPVFGHPSGGGGALPRPDIYLANMSSEPPSEAMIRLIRPWFP